MFKSIGLSDLDQLEMGEMKPSFKNESYKRFQKMVAESSNTHHRRN